MSSSDSDDYYSGVTKKLQLLKKKYNDDMSLSTDLLKDSTDVTNINSGGKIAANDHSILLDDEVHLDDLEEVTLDNIIAKNSKRRFTRSQKLQLRTPKQISKRQPNLVKPPTSKQTHETSGSKRGRGTKPRQTSGKRGRCTCRTRNSSSTIQLSSNTDQDIPTYSIGNTHEYPDLSDDQQLFSSNQNNVIFLQDDADVVNSFLTEDLTEEYSVKVYWQSSEFVKFTIRKYQKFTEIFDYFTKKENVSHDNLVFMYNDRIVQTEDTPDTIKYNIAKFIEGGVINRSVKCLATKNKSTEKGLKLLFRCENVKKPFEVIVQGNDKLSIAMVKCAEHFERPLQKLKFLFDGEKLSGTNTPKDLDLEGGECIDVKIIK